MKFCVRCGRQLDDNIQFCTGCGMKQPDIPPELLFRQPQPNFQLQTSLTQNPDNPQTSIFPESTVSMQTGTAANNAFMAAGYFPQVEKKSGAVHNIVWSLILFVFFNPIGTPLSMIAAILSVIARADEDSEKCERYLRMASTMCIIATVVDIATFFLFAGLIIPIFHNASGL